MAPANLVAVGGDYQAPDGASRVAIYSPDGGKSWHLAETQPGGYRSAVVSLSHREFAAVGTTGTDVSQDEGIHWEHTDKLNLNAAGFAGTEGWAVGPKGTIARFQNHFFHEIKSAKPSRETASAAGKWESEKLHLVRGGGFLSAEARVRAHEKFIKFVLR